MRWISKIERFLCVIQALLLSNCDFMCPSLVSGGQASCLFFFNTREDKLFVYLIYCKGNSID